MSLQVGIVGLPNVGKSTLFNALSRAGAPVAPYPFTTIDRHVGVAEAPDPRLRAIASIIQPERTVPATVEFVDIAGLVKGAHKGEGLGNQFLGHIRNVDALAMVLRCFVAPDVAHVSATLDPLTDLEVVDLELTLADLETVERRLEKVRGAAKARPKEVTGELALLERLQAHLATGQSARLFFTDPEGADVPADLKLLTAKPRLYVANVGEEDLPQGGPLAEQVLAQARREGAEAIVLCAELEATLAEWPEDEAAAYRQELELSQPGLNRLVEAGYRLLKLITFFTATGGHEVRAWPLRMGSTAWEAAGKVHTDMQRGFIRAEVIGHDELLAVGSLSAARERGLLRLEGRDYIVRDGDLIHFRFAV
jgi:GTP-binding protein YchF